MKFRLNMLPLCIFSVIAAVNANADVLKKLAIKLEQGVQGQENKKVAVLNFTYPGGALSSGSTIVQERLTTYLVQNGKVEVIERNLLNKVLEEMKLEMTGVIDASTTKELGKVLGVSAIVTGTLHDTSHTKTEINARIIETTTGKIMAAGQARVERTWTDVPVKPPKQLVTPDPVTPPDTTPGHDGQFLGKPLIQIAILLDTSNSMDGLIAQTKAQLWKIVNELTSSEKDGDSPAIQVALYEYGNDNLGPGENYIRQILPFSADLDNLSEKLFGLTTRGGQEYAGAVIKDAVNNLQWDNHTDIYKVIFIAGNEPFTQGPVDFREAVTGAVNKGIIVNTIFCGNKQEGIATQWKAGADASSGDFLNIDQDIQVVSIQAPQDNEIAKLGTDLNQTYIPYGGAPAEAAYERQAAEDTSASVFSRAGTHVERAIFKSKAQYDSAATWDLVNEVTSGRVKPEEVKKEQLPQNLQKMNGQELKTYIDSKIAERQTVQKRINELSQERRQYIAGKEKEMAQNQGQETLGQALLKAVRSQASKKQFHFKD